MISSNTNEPRASPASFQDISRMGVSLSTRPVTSVSTRVGTNNDHSESDNTIQEKAWTLSNLVERFAFLDTYDWTTTMSPHTIIKKLRIPQDLLASEPATTPFRAFQFWRGDVEIQAQVTSNPLTQGMLLMVFIPLTSEEECDLIVSNFSSATVNQCCYLYANANTTARMTIPYNSPQSYLDVSQFSSSSPLNSLGYIYLVVFNPIELASSGTDSTTVSIFSSFINNAFKVPRSQVSARHQSLSKLDDPMTMISNISKAILPDHLVDDALTVGKLFTALDKPNDPRTDQSVVLTSTGRLNFSEGVEHIDKLTPFPALINPATTETFATSVDETDFSYLYKRYSYLGSFKFKQTDTVGKQLAYFPLNPFPSQLSNKSVSQIPLLSYLASIHKFWSGSLNYKIQVVSTSFQTGKIFFAFNYGNFDPAAVPTAIAATSQYGQAYELNQGSNELEFTVPYVSITPYLNVPNSNQPSNLDSLGYLRVISLNKLSANNNTPTEITINVFIAGGDDFKLSTLTTGNQLIPFLQKSTITNKLPKMADGFELIAKHQSAAQPLITPENDISLAAENLVAPNSSTQQRTDTTTQKSAQTVMHYLKKYQLLPSIFVKPISEDSRNKMFFYPVSNIFSSLIPATAPPYTPVSNNGLLSFLSQIYRQFRGGVRFKAMIDTINEISSLSVFYEPPAVNFQPDSSDSLLNNLENSFFPIQTTDFYSGDAVPSSYNDISKKSWVNNSTPLPISYANTIVKTLEFEIPFTSIFSSILTEPELDLGLLRNYNDLGYLVFVVSVSPSGSSSPTQLRLFASLSDEARLANLYRVPFVSPNSLIADSTFANNYEANYLPPTTSTNNLIIL
jgi:hypothetical protein